MIGLELDSNSPIPLYRQLYENMAARIKLGSFGHGERLPATRELANQLSLNRATVSAAYALLEENGLIHGHVGRGSFVDYEGPKAVPPTPTAPQEDPFISFASSRPSGEEFPLDDFQTSCQEVISGPRAASILQLGPPNGFVPLRHYLLEEARRLGEAGPHDDILITNGCQQALDLLQRTLVGSGEPVAMEDPVYHGLKNVFSRGGARVLGVPVGPDGIEIDPLRQALLKDRPKLLLVTSNFQNPTGASLSLEARHEILRLARESGVRLIENNIYGDLRYEGEAMPSLKQMDSSGDTILLRSFSKIAFPGLRVGWVIAPRAIIARLAETKQWCDLHTDQLSQAILLRFAETGRLAAHIARVRQAGVERLRTVLSACERHLPSGTEFTRPQGGMSLWVRLPEPLDAAELLPRAQQRNVTYLPGNYFAVSKYEPGTLRISFGGLPPARIEQGLAILGRVFQENLARVHPAGVFDESPAMV